MNSTLLPVEANVIFSEEIVVRENRDGTVIVMKMDDTDLFYKINGAAADIFKDLRNDIEIKDTISKTAQKYNIDQSRVHSDLSDFLRKLASLNFIKLC